MFPRALHLCHKLAFVTPVYRYGTYKLVKNMAGGEKLVAFTRILHRQTPDVLMDEVRSRAQDWLAPKGRR